MVEGEGSLEESRTSEGNQPNAIRAKFTDEVLHEQLGSLQTGGSYVGGQHGARDVHGNDDVAAAMRNLG